MNRRSALNAITYLGASTVLPSFLSFSSSMQSMMTREIGVSGQRLPVIGLGTWQTFDVGTAGLEQETLKKVLTDFTNAGSTVVDTSPMYGRAEQVLGSLSSELNLNDKLFMATKVWTTGKEAGIRQMENSFKLLKRKQIDLLQVHNLVDWQVHLKTLEAWKADGKIRFIGLTHYTDGAHDTLKKIIQEHAIDFIQINYSLDSRNAEKTLLPLAREKGVAVLINRPFNEGALFRLIKGKQLPGWAHEFDCESWGCFFLKFILANPAVTCVIPATSNTKHLADNLSAGIGKLPDASHLKKMIAMVS